MTLLGVLGVLGVLGESGARGESGEVEVAAAPGAPGDEVVSSRWRVGRHVPGVGGAQGTARRTAAASPSYCLSGGGTCLGK